MLYTVRPELFARYPGYVRGVVVVTHAINLEGPIESGADAQENSKGAA
jgi:hypothetical protein